MAFVRMKGIDGLVFVPEDTGAAKKHPCADCYRCQWCSDNRCALCLRNTSTVEDPQGSGIIRMGSILRKCR